MNNLYKLIIIFPFLITGCSPNVIKENKVVQKIESLDMNIFSNEGEKIYSVKSPYSSYDKSNQKFQLRKTTINIFKGEETKYIIDSDESSLSNNNKQLELKGNVKMITINQEDEILYADSFSWNIDETYYLLKGNIRFENKNIILNSEKATLGRDNIIEFYNPVKYIIKDDNNEKKYEINSENAFYNINTESVSFSAKEERVRSKIYF